jgi:acetylornithine deacetylase
VDDLEECKKIALAAFDDRVSVSIATETPAIHMEPIEGFETSIVKYTTDIPKLSNWGQPLLLGPGTIHVAHTLDERVSKKEVAEAVDLYTRLVKQLKTTTKTTKN